MAILYVSNVVGDNSTGLTWATAFTSISASLANSSNRDVIYVDSAHNYTANNPISWTVPTTGNEISIISVDRGGSTTTGHSGWLPGAKESTGAIGQFIVGGVRTGKFYLYGLYLQANSGSGNFCTVEFSCPSFGDGQYIADTCTFNTSGSNTNSPIAFGNGTANTSLKIYLYNCTFRLRNASTGGGISIRAATVFAHGCTVEYNGSKPPYLLFTPAIGGGNARFVDCDLSGFNNGTYVDATLYGSNILIQNCKLHSSTSKVTTTFQNSNSEIIFINSDSNNTTNTFEFYKRNGSVVEDTTVYYTLGAKYSDNTNISWLALPTAEATPHTPFYTPWMTTWNNVSGSQIIASTRILIEEYDSLSNVDVWTEFEYLADNTSTKGTLYSTRNSNPFLTEYTGNKLLSDITSNWTTTGMSIPTAYQMTHSFVPARKGMIRARIGMTVNASNAGLYIDPQMTVTGT